MKLLARNNRDFLVSALVLLVACIGVLYLLLQFVIRKDMNDNLKDMQREIEMAFNQHGVVPANQNLSNNRIVVQPATNNIISGTRLSDTLIYDAFEKEYVAQRNISFALNNGSLAYNVTISQSKLESEDLLTTLMIFLVIFIVALFAVFYFLNRTHSKKLWLPFNRTLDQLHAFNLSASPVVFNKTGIFEFDELNHSLNMMTERIYAEYGRLKQFTENASHELQTPLSIIRSKIEMLIQSPAITEDHMNAIQQINNSVSKLSKLNTALLTLAKIENRQFVGSSTLSLTLLIKEKLVAAEDLLKARQINVTQEVADDVTIMMHPALADLLFDNLISNAIRHNAEGGFIAIILQPHHFSITNSTLPLAVPVEQLFERFIKNNTATDSLGLGLSIVKEICSRYEFRIHAGSAGDRFEVSLDF